MYKSLICIFTALIIIVLYLPFSIHAQPVVSTSPDTLITATPAIPPIDYGNTQIIPVPGSNCGVADRQGKNACCISSAGQFGIDPHTGSDIPVIGGIVSGIAGILGGFIDKLPFSFFPDDAVKNLPTWQKLKDASGKIKPCLDDGIATPVDLGGKSMCICQADPNSAVNKLTKNCKMIKNLAEQQSCVNCVVGTYSEDSNGKPLNYIKGMWTSLGCINTSSPKDFIEKTVFGIGIGLAGLISLGCIIFAAVQVQLSQGNPEKLKKSQEMMTSCITGLMLIIFSIFILHVIGVDILRLPGIK